ncbi:MAG: mono/diheme cytochrome c family protein [Rhodothermales bacterium]|jgi:mono/diheme cytochrome c family protein
MMAARKGEKRTRRLWPLLIGVLLLAAVITGVQRADRGPAEAPLVSPGPELMHSLQTHCAGCHGDKATKKKGDFDLAILGPEPNDVTLPAWKDVLDLIQMEEMPPEDEPQPTPDERQQMVSWLTARIQAHEYELQQRQAVTQLRRLTPDQYWNSLEDLLGPGHIVHTEVPDFDLGAARDNYQLAMTPEHLDSFIRIAEEALEQKLIPFTPPKAGHLSYNPGSRKIGLLTQKTFAHNYVSIDGAIGLLNNGNTKYGVHTQPFEIATWPILVPGRYQIRVTARAESQRSKAPVSMGIAARHHKVMLHAKGVEGSRTIKEVQLAPSNSFTVTDCEVEISLGDTIVVQKRSGKHDGGMRKGMKAADITEHLLVVKTIDIRGPLTESWPPPAMKRLFGYFPRSPSDEAALDMLYHFAEKAYRRPISSDHQNAIAAFFEKRLTTRPRTFSPTIWRPPNHGDQRYKNRFRGAVQANQAYGNNRDWRIESAVLDTCVSIMVNQHFLFRAEPEQPDGFAIASRLSYFLWDGPPDSTLKTMAEDGRLTTPKGQSSAARHCLDDKKAHRFYRAFVDDWLGTDQVGVMEPDQRLYGKRYDDSLRRAMREQSISVFRELIRQNAPAVELLKSDWTMVNDRLAAHYGIPKVEGHQFRRVALTERTRIRGSVLGHAGIMSVLSNGTETLPISRGVWVLENLLGLPPPPPPPNVPLIEPDVRGAKTLQEQLAQHRDNKSCNRCHKEIDPIGIALENFDAIGTWRDHYPNTARRKLKKGTRIDNTEQLPNGAQIRGPLGLADYLVKQQDAFHHCLVTKLFEYALGRPLAANETSAVDDVLDSSKADSNRLRSLILAAASHPLLVQ